MWLPCGFYCATAPRHELRDFRRAWWTGKDSNLRSPQGAADLQSAGFSHSPTRPSVSISGFQITKPEIRRDANSCPKIVLLQCSQRICANETQKKIGSTETQKGLVSKDTSPFNFNCRNCSASLPADFWWSWRRELNPRPSDYKSDALPAELRQRRSNRVRIADKAQKLQEAGEGRSTVRASAVENQEPVSRSYSELSILFSIDYKVAIEFQGAESNRLCKSHILLKNCLPTCLCSPALSKMHEVDISLERQNAIYAKQ